MKKHATQIGTSGLLFKNTTNTLLDRLKNGPMPPYVLEPEIGLATTLEVSRSTLRKALQRLVDLGLIEKRGRMKYVRRAPEPADYFPVESNGQSNQEAALSFIMAKLARHDLHPDCRFSELELARESGCSRTTIREALLRVSRFGLIEKNPRQQWRVVSLDTQSMHELVEVRAMMETFALRQLFALSEDHPIWERFEGLLQEHLAYAQQSDPDAAQFKALDRRFHRVLLSACGNRYINSFFSICDFTTDYLLQPKSLLFGRVERAMSQHVAILRAILRREEDRGQEALMNHLETTRRYLVEAVMQA